MWLIVLTVIVVVMGFTAFFGAPYVPVHGADIRRAFDELYKLSSKDVLLDLGSGDGKVLREAARRGARAVGYELNPVLVGVARLLSHRQRRVAVRLANIWRMPFPDDVTVVYVFADGRDIGKVARKVQRETDRLGRPLWLVSYGFRFAERTPVKENGGHFLYEFTPLQGREAQV